MAPDREPPAAPAENAAAITDVLPHRPPMLLVESILERAPGFVSCRCRVGRDTPLAAGDAITSLLALELAAQASAFMAPSPGPPSGEDAAYLVSIRRAAFHTAELPVGVPLRVEVRLTGRAGGLQLVKVRIASESEPLRTLAEGELGTFVGAATRSSL